MRVIVLFQKFSNQTTLANPSPPCIPPPPLSLGTSNTAAISVCCGKTVVQEKANPLGHSLDARVQSAVDGTVEEQEALHDGDVVVEVRGMGLELFVVVGGEEAPGPPAVIVQRHPFAGVLAQVVGTPVPVLFETVLFLLITEKRQTKNLYTKRRPITHYGGDVFFGFYEEKEIHFRPNARLARHTSPRHSEQSQQQYYSLTVLSLIVLRATTNSLT